MLNVEQSGEAVGRGPIVSSYRPEIDGLRAFSVIAVIINHLNSDILPGGYLGVDIFFVISGYVITSSLYGRQNSKGFGDFIASFYERRVKRLVPALALFTLITSIVYCLFDPTPGISLRTGISSLFGLSNIYLLRQSTDYFAPSTELNAFTHTWSLAVEEQFYILFPFLIWLTGFGRGTQNGERNLFLVVGALAVPSLMGFIWLYQMNQPAAYFLMPTRFWEMASGCLILIIFKKRTYAEKVLENVSPLLVISLMVGVMCLPTSRTSAATIAIVALSAALIACLKKTTASFKIFTHPKVVYIGLISYSLYLWHWGVLSISRWTIGIHWWSVPFQVVLIFGLAIASYRWVETPFRKANWPGRRSNTLLIGGGILASTSGILFILNKPFYVKAYIGPVPREKAPLTNDGRLLSESCYSNSKGPKQIIKECMLIDKNEAQTLWLLGDSHAGAMLFASSEIATRKAMSLFTYFYGGTAFPATPYKRVDNSRMLIGSAIMSELETEIITNFKRGDIVMIGMRHPYHFGEDWYEYPVKDFRFMGQNGSYIKAKSKSYYLNQWINNLKTFADIARRKGVNIIISTPTPEFPLAKGMPCQGVDENWFNILSRKDCGTIPASLLIGENGIYNTINAALREIADTNDNIYLFDAFRAMCQDSICKRLDDGKSLYRDDDHISNYAMQRRITPALYRFIQKNNL